VLVVIEVFDDLSAVPLDVRGLVRRTIPTRWPEPAVIARAYSTDDPDGERLDEPGHHTWVIARSGGPVKPGDVVEDDPRFRSAQSASGVIVSPAGSISVGPVIYGHHLIVVRRAGEP
jgi:hypothetical protein